MKSSYHELLVLGADVLDGLHSRGVRFDVGVLDQPTTQRVDALGEVILDGLAVDSSRPSGRPAQRACWPAVATRRWTGLPSRHRRCCRRRRRPWRAASSTTAVADYSGMVDGAATVEDADGGSRVEHDAETLTVTLLM